MKCAEARRTFDYLVEKYRLDTPIVLMWGEIRDGLLTEGDTRPPEYPTRRQPGHIPVTRGRESFYWRPGLLRTWDALIDRHVAENGVEVIADFRDTIRPEFQQRIARAYARWTTYPRDPVYYPAGTEPTPSR